MSREKIKKNQENCNAVVKNEIQAQAREPPEEPARAEHLECIGCPYSAHGFVCWPGDCLRTRMAQIQKKGGKGHFIVMKTGIHPTRTRLRLFLEWGISFEESYTVPKRENAVIRYYLEMHGYIKKEYRHRDNGSLTSNLYRLK